MITKDKPWTGSHLNIYSLLFFFSKRNLQFPYTPCHAPTTCNVPRCFSPPWLCCPYAPNVLFLASVSSQPSLDWRTLCMSLAFLPSSPAQFLDWIIFIFSTQFKQDNVGKRLSPYLPLASLQSQAVTILCRMKITFPEGVQVFCVSLCLSH